MKNLKDLNRALVSLGLVPFTDHLTKVGVAERMASVAMMLEAGNGDALTVGSAFVLLCEAGLAVSGVTISILAGPPPPPPPPPKLISDECPAEDDHEGVLRDQAFAAVERVQQARSAFAQRGVMEQTEMSVEDQKKYLLLENEVHDAEESLNALCGSGTWLE